MARFTEDIHSGEKISDGARILVKVVDGIKIFGYTDCREEIIEGDDTLYYRPNFEDKLMYSKACGKDIVIPDQNDMKTIVFHKFMKQSGFPYHFTKRYEAIESFNIFKNKQYVNHEYLFPLSNFCKYTFGLEFETSSGIVPEDICFRDGLIPLRDGSITGNEYSTVILRGNNGFNLLKQQLNTLKEYTRFNKECSLHMHFGNFPLEPDKIFNLYLICRKLEPTIEQIIPSYSFYTSKYKASGKDYCKKLFSVSDFDQLYYKLTGRKYFGSLTEAHPNDVGRERKWNIPQRYYWANFINLICYNVNKTIEFRFLRPTYNLEKVLFWIYVFNAILCYAESFKVNINSELDLLSILKVIYPPEIQKLLEEEYWKCYFCTTVQESEGDRIGSRIDIEQEFFDSNKII